MRLSAFLLVIVFVIGCKSSEVAVSDNPCERIPTLSKEIADLRALQRETGVRIDNRSVAVGRETISTRLRDKRAELERARELCAEKSGFQELADARLILEARGRSNAGIANGDAAAVMAEIDSAFQGTGGDGGFAANYDEMAAIFADELSADPPIFYVRNPESVEVSESKTRAFENGTWRGGEGENTDMYGGRYSAHWVKTESGWKIRSEIYVTMYSDQ